MSFGVVQFNEDGKCIFAMAGMTEEDAKKAAEDLGGEDEGAKVVPEDIAFGHQTRMAMGL